MSIQLKTRIAGLLCASLVLPPGWCRAEFSTGERLRQTEALLSDGAEGAQSLADTRIRARVVFVLEASAAGPAAQFEHLKEAVLGAVTLLRSGDYVSVIPCNDFVEVSVPLEDVNSSERIVTAVKRLTSGGRQDWFSCAARALGEVNSLQIPPTLEQRMLVLLTVAGTSDVTAPARSVLKSLRSEGVEILVFEIGKDQKIDASFDGAAEGPLQAIRISDPAKTREIVETAFGAAIGRIKAPEHFASDGEE